MPLNQRMDKEKCGTFTQCSNTQQEKNDILKFAGKWMDLENTILSELIQIQKDKYHMYSLISGF